MRLLAFPLLLTSALSAQTITIAPAPVDRAALVVRVPCYPFKKDPNRLCAFDATGKSYPMQEELLNYQVLSKTENAKEMERRTAEFVAIHEGKVPTEPVRHMLLTVGFLPANKTLRLTVQERDNPSRVTVKTDSSGNPMLAIDGNVRLTYQTSKKNKPRHDISDDILRAGYLHPVRSPSGAIVTGDYPSNHPHHHGIWTPYTKAVFQGRTTDFWNMQNKKGRVDLVGFALNSSGNGGVYEKLNATTGMIDLTGPKETTALWEASMVLLYDIPDTPRPMVAFDLITEQACATQDPVELPEYHYGSFGLRGPDEWDGKEGARFLTSEGITDRKKGDGTRARWCYLGGKTSAGISGTAVLGYPDNFRFPMPLRLHPDMPYFSIVPQKLGAFTIKPGERYVTRYRFIITDGEPDAKLFDACWNSLAHPAKVSFSK